jgi:ankyrin repeat protein
MKLIDAIRADNAEEVRKALRRTRDVNKPLSGGYTAVEIAARGGKVNVIPVLLEAGADPHARRAAGTSALGRAADAGQLEAVKLLLRLVTFGEQELADAATAAARQRQVPILELLRGAGAKLDAAMEWAVRDGHTDVVRWCLGAGIDPNLRVRRERPAAEREGRVIWAAALGDEADFTVADALLAAGADATLVDRDGNDALRILITEHGPWLEDEDPPAADDDEFAEHDRRYRGWVRDLERQIRAAGATGGNPANAALFDAIRRKDARAVRTLLAHGAEVTARNPNDRDGGTPLLAAVGAGVEVVRALLDAGADVNDGGRATRPVIGAAHTGRLDVLRLLVDAGADVNLPEPKSPAPGEPAWNALYYAKINRKPDVVEYLLSVGARMPEAPDVPFESGVEFPDTFVEAMVKAPVAAVAGALAVTIGGQSELDAWGRSFRAGRQSYAVIRLDGSQWCSVLGVSGTGRVTDRRWEDLCRELSRRCGAPVALLCHEDVSGHSGYDLYDGEAPPPESLGSGEFCDS